MDVTLAGIVIEVRAVAKLNVKASMDASVLVPEKAIELIPLLWNAWAPMDATLAGIVIEVSPVAE
jgi:hypothetical protein